MTIVSGIYHQGRIDLLEVPEGLREGRVRITVIEEAEPVQEKKCLVRGKYASGRLSTLHDFQDVEAYRVTKVFRKDQI